LAARVRAARAEARRDRRRAGAPRRLARDDPRDPVTALDALVERSRRIGADPALVLFGGGNTSSKLVEEGRRVLRIKGSGSDLATCIAADFPGLWLDDLLAL